MHANTAMRHAQAPKHAQFQKGAVMVEFAFILPLFLLLLFGVITFSIAIYNKTVLTMATRQGARAGSVYDADNYNTDSTVKGDYVAAKAKAAADQVCSASLISFGPGMNYTPSTATVNGKMLTVSASVQYTGLYIFSNALTVSAQTSMRIE